MYYCNPLTKAKVNAGHNVLPSSGGTALASYLIYMGGCHNYCPFLDPYYNTAPNI